MNSATSKCEDLTGVELTYDEPTIAGPTSAGSTDRELLQQTARQHRQNGNSMAAVAELMGLTIGHVWSLLSVRTPELPPPVETADTVVKRFTFNGGFSGGCRDVFISMPRITSIDGDYKPSNDNNMATALTA